MNTNDENDLSCKISALIIENNRLHNNKIKFNEILKYLLNKNNELKCNIKSLTDINNCTKKEENNTFKLIEENNCTEKEENNTFKLAEENKNLKSQLKCLKEYEQLSNKLLVSERAANNFLEMALVIAYIIISIFAALLIIK